MNLYLISKAYTLVSLKGDNEAKQIYYTALEQNHTENKNEPFNLLVAQSVVNSLTDYLKIIEG